MCAQMKFKVGDSMFFFYFEKLWSQKNFFSTTCIHPQRPQKRKRNFKIIFCAKVMNSLSRESNKIWQRRGAPAAGGRSLPQTDADCRKLPRTDTDCRWLSAPSAGRRGAGKWLLHSRDSQKICKKPKTLNFLSNFLILTQIFAWTSN